MDNILVGIIVAGALFFCIRSFVRTYRGQGECNCSSGCGCSSREKQISCSQGRPFKPLNKN
jgi:hypothetical protein